MMRAEGMRRPETVEPDRPDAATGEPPQRLAAHRTKTDDDHIGVHQECPPAASSWPAALCPLQTAPSMFACQV